MFAVPTLAALTPFPAVISTNHTDNPDSQSTSWTENLPASRVPGNRLLAVVGFNNFNTGTSAPDASNTVNIPAGWTSLFDQIGTLTGASDNAGYVRAMVWTRVIDGSEGSTISVTTSTGCLSSVMYQLAGARRVSVGWQEGRSANPDCPPFSARQGFGNLLMIGALIHPSQLTVAAPTNYSSPILGGLAGGDAILANVLCFQRNLRGRNDDPGGATSGAPSRPYIGLTIAVSG